MFKPQIYGVFASPQSVWNNLLLHQFLQLDSIIPLPDDPMKASAIRTDVREIVKLERAVPQVAIATATIKFQLTGNLSFLQDDSISKEKRAERLSKLLLKALQEIDLQ